MGSDGKHVDRSGNTLLVDQTDGLVLVSELNRDGTAVDRSVISPQGQPVVERKHS